MQKVQRTAGKSFETLTVGGKTYTLRPLKVGAYAELEAYVMSQRVDLVAATGAAITKIPQSMHAAVWDACMRNVLASRNVTAQEVQAFEQSVRGYAWKLWQCVKEDHPEIDSIDKAMELLVEAGPQRAEEIDLKLRLASGEADLGKLSGQTPATDQGQAGQPSTSSS